MSPASYHALAGRVRWNSHPLSERECRDLLADYDKEAKIAFDTFNIPGFIEISAKAGELRAAMAAVNLQPQEPSHV